MTPTPVEQRPLTPNTHSWRAKFADAFRGIRAVICQEKSFHAHLAIGTAVLLAAGLMRMGFLQWSILLLCITIVMTAEMGNSALEEIARAWGGEYNEHLGAALDMAAGMVLVAAFGAAATGGVVFVERLGALAGWWR